MIFQIYTSKDDDLNFYLLDTAKEHCAKAIITAGATVSGNCKADVINHFKFSLEMFNLTHFGKVSLISINQLFSRDFRKMSSKDIEKAAERANRPVMVKGIRPPEYDLFTMEAGTSAVYVFNHGGPGSSFDVTEFFAEVIAGRVPVIFDGEVRRAQHMFKALASGTVIVGICRPVMYATVLLPYFII